MRTRKREWEEDLDEASIEREAAADIKRRVPLPDVGESVRVTFLGEPRKIPPERTGLEWDMFVADVDDGSGETRQMICPKSLRQHLAAMLERGELECVEGSTVIVSAEAIDSFETKRGEVVPHAKVYRLTLPSSELWTGRGNARRRTRPGRDVRQPDPFPVEPWKVRSEAVDGDVACTPVMSGRCARDLAATGTAGRGPSRRASG